MSQSGSPDAGDVGIPPDFRKRLVSANRALILPGMGTSIFRRGILQVTIAALLTATAVRADTGRSTGIAGGQPEPTSATTPAAAPAEPQQEPEEEAKVTAAAHRLLRDFLAKRYTAIGERLEIALSLDTPAPVQGWAGRWRFPGTATLHHYHDTAEDGPTRRRVVEIKETKNLSATQKYRLIERTTFIRTENIAFEACVTGTGADATLDFTLR